VSTYLLNASDRLPGVHPAAEDLFCEAYELMSSQMGGLLKTTTQERLMEYARSLPDYSRVFKNQADAVSQCEAWLKNPPYQLYASGQEVTNMNKELLQAAKQRVKAELRPDTDVGGINNPTLQTQVSGLIAAGFLSVLHLSTDGYNEPETGSAGVEIHFTGAAKSAISYGSSILDLKGIRALTEWLEETESKLPGLEVELMVDDEGDLSLLVLTDAT